jgi:hypothetical protein
MRNETLPLTVLLKRGHTEEFKTEDVVLWRGELCAEYNDSGFVGYKQGDGTKKWSELEYVDLNKIEAFRVVCRSTYDNRPIRTVDICLDPIKAKELSEKYL